MAQTRTPEPDGRRAQLEDTPLHNPLSGAVRDRAAHQFEQTAAAVAAGLDGGPNPDELADLELNVPDLRQLAAQVANDIVPFSAARKMQTLLSHADDHALRGAGAALDAMLSDALPQRRRALAREMERLAAEQGFAIQTVPGREEPLPLPHFAYTRGLGANASHPELVIVGMPVSVARWVLRDLSMSIVGGQRTLRAGDEVDGVLRPGFTLRIAECPRHLVTRMGQDTTAPDGALQVLLPDEAGRLPGDPGLDPRYARAQRYPSHPA